MRLRGITMARCGLFAVTIGGCASGSDRIARLESRVAHLEAMLASQQAPSRPDADAGMPLTCTGTKQNVNPLWRLATVGGGRSCVPHTELPGTKRPGDQCEHPVECAPVCCACAAPDRTALASYCVSGRCATADQVCCAVAGTVTNSCNG